VLDRFVARLRPFDGVAARILFRQDPVAAGDRAARGVGVVVVVVDLVRLVVQARLVEVPRLAVGGVGLEARSVAHAVEGPLLAALVVGGDAVVCLIDGSERPAAELLLAIEAVVGGTRRRC